jgi:hypothetical protein
MPLSFPMWLRKKWYLKDKYLFLADILGELTVERHPWLSSKTVDRIKESSATLRSSLEHNSLRRALMGSTSRIAMLKATYSAAVELNVISDCNLEDQMIGQPKRVSTKPVLDFTDTGS